MVEKTKDQLIAELNILKEKLKNVESERDQAYFKINELNQRELRLTENLNKKKDIEKELIDSKNYLNKIINSIADPIFVKDIKHRWVLLNDAYCNFMGYDFNTLQYKSDYDFFPKNEAEVFWEKDNVVFENGIENENEEFFTDAEDKTHTIMTKKSLYTDNSGNKFIVGIIRDITDRKEMEQKLLDTLDKLEKKNKELDEFAHILSHDLKSPLSVMFYIIEWIEEDLNNNNINSETLDNFGLLKKNVTRMNNMINAVLEYSKSTRQIQPDQSVDVKKMLMEIDETSVAPQNFTMIIPDYIPLVKTESIKLEQIFNNIISNAIKHNDKKSGKIEISYQTKGKFHEFTVSDNGPGIDKRDHDKIFQLFNTLKPKKDYGQDTGIGLTIVKKLVEDKGGSISVESEPGKGSSFMFTIPKI